MSQINRRTNGPLRPNDPWVGAVAIDVSSTDQVLVPTARGVFVGGNGALEVEFIDGSTATFSGLVAPAFYAMAIRKIVKAGTTITNSYALM